MQSLIPKKHNSIKIQFHCQKCNDPVSFFKIYECINFDSTAQPIKEPELPNVKKNNILPKMEVLCNLQKL